MLLIKLNKKKINKMRKKNTTIPTVVFIDFTSKYSDNIYVGIQRHQYSGCNVSYSRCALSYTLNLKNHIVF